MRGLHSTNDPLELIEFCFRDGVRVLESGIRPALHFACKQVNLMKTHWNEDSILLLYS